MYIEKGSAVEQCFFNMKVLLICACVLSAFVRTVSATRILFGSCNKVQLEQPLWPHILERKPSVYIWGGDNVYADHMLGLGFDSSWWPRARFRATNETNLRTLYTQQRHVHGYKLLRDSGAHVVGTWDDHDYGTNDGDRSFQGRRWSQQAFLDFMDEPANSKRRKQEGVYAAHQFSFDGANANASLLVVLLDMRYHRDPYNKAGEGDFLGEEQWQWLNHTLATSTARAHLIVSSVQLLEPRQGLAECWGRFPAARERFLKLLMSRRLAAPIVLSGDVHFAELSMASCTGGSRLLELTSSGMTHSWGTAPPNARLPLVGTYMHFAMWLAQRLMPWHYQMVNELTGARQHYLGINFAELEYHWAEQRVTTRVFGTDGRARLSRSFSLAELDINPSPSPSSIGSVGNSGHTCAPFGASGADVPQWQVFARSTAMAMALLTPLLCILLVLGWILARLISLCKLAWSRHQKLD